MGTLRKRKAKNGKVVYLVDFYFQGRRLVRSTKTGDFKTANLILKDIEAKIARNAFNVDEIKTKKSIYLDQFVKEILEYSRNHKAHSTFLRDQLCFKNFINFAGKRLLTSIDAKLMDEYLNFRVKGVTKSTVNIELRHLKAAFTKAEAWKYIKSNPCKKIKPFSIQETAPVFFSAAQLRVLLSIIKEPWLAHIVEFDANTGLRLNEVVNLEWRDIDLARRIIRVSQKNDFVTKSKRERNIPINNRVHDLLEKIERCGEYVFTRNYAKRLDKVFVTKKFKSYVRKGELGEQYTFHSLRHTFASHLVQKGVSLYIVSKLLGHSNLKTTEIYAHLAPETFKKVVDLLDF